MAGENAEQSIETQKTMQVKNLFTRLEFMKHKLEKVFGLLPVTDNPDLVDDLSDKAKTALHNFGFDRPDTPEAGIFDSGLAKASEWSHQSIAAMKYILLFHVEMTARKLGPMLERLEKAQTENNPDEQMNSLKNILGELEGLDKYATLLSSMRSTNPRLFIISATKTGRAITPDGIPCTFTLLSDKEYEAIAGNPQNMTFINNFLERRNSINKKIEVMVDNGYLGQEQIDELLKPLDNLLFGFANQGIALDMAYQHIEDRLREIEREKEDSDIEHLIE